MKLLSPSINMQISCIPLIIACTICIFYIGIYHISSAEEITFHSYPLETGSYCAGKADLEFVIFSPSIPDARW